jgi:hypothetical protein
LRETLFHVDAEDILKIPVGPARTGDYLAWNYTKKRLFSVKMAYHLKSQLKLCQVGRPGPSNGCDEHRGWLALWTTDVPSKVKVHYW